MKNIIPKPFPWFAVLYFAFAASLIYFYFQIQSLNRQLAALTLPPVIPTSIPEESIIPEEEESTSIPTTKSSSAINITYSLPAGWTQINLKDSQFSIGYDPANMSIYTNQPDRGLVIRSNDTTRFYYADFIATELPYDGGSRHTFIRRISGSTNADNLPEYHEKEYLIGGKKCLFLIGIQFSQSMPTWGMCPLSNTRAVLISLLTMDDSQIESTLRTVKLTK